MTTTKSACILLQRRFVSAAAAVRPSAAEVRSHRNAVFSREQSRQRALFPRIEKIEVSMQGPGLDGTLLIMNKGMSTPLSCAKHLTEYHVYNSVLALVDTELWPIHKPLTESCSLRLLTFKDNDPTAVNQAYWRSCSALLGQVLETAFKDDYSVELLSSLEVPVTLGAFCCDVVLDPQLDSWTPTEETLRSLTRSVHQLIQQDLPFEPLDVVPSVAFEVFSHSRSKQEEVEKAASESPRGTVQLYRCGDHVLLSSGPLISRTGLCSQFDMTAFHTVGPGPLGLQRRLQGLSLPYQLQAHHTVWRRLKKRAEKMIVFPLVNAAPAPPALSPETPAVDPPASSAPDPPASSSPDPPASSAPDPPASSAPDPPASSAPDPPASSASDPPASSSPDPPASSSPDPPASSSPDSPASSAPDPPAPSAPSAPSNQ